VQHQTLKSLREQNAALQEHAVQMEELRAANEKFAKLNVDAEELARLRNQNGELLRLRGEVGRLRQEKTDMERLAAAENARLREAMAEIQTARQGRPATFTPEQQQFRDETIARMNQAKQWARAFIMYAEDHNGQLPASFAEAKATFQSNNSKLDLLDDTNFEVVFAGSRRDLTNSLLLTQTVLIREKEPRRSPGGKLVKTYAFADGHAEAVTAPNGDFAELEKTRNFVVRGN